MDAIIKLICEYLDYEMSEEEFLAKDRIYLCTGKGGDWRRRDNSIDRTRLVLPLLLNWVASVLNY